MYHQKELRIEDHCSRHAIRVRVVSTFLDEEPGTGRGGDSSIYRYDVESLSDGKKVYLMRPAHLNKGLDFTVHVEGMKFERGDRPSHKSIVADLRRKATEDPEMASKLLHAIEAVYKCGNPDSVLPKRVPAFKTGYSVEMLLRVIRWLFIEQDVTYWNYSGRNMLMSGIKDTLSRTGT